MSGRGIARECLHRWGWGEGQTRASVYRVSKEDLKVQIFQASGHTGVAGPGL